MKSTDKYKLDKQDQDEYKQERYKLDQYKITKSIGRGKFGNVYKATCKKTEETVAIKVIYKSEIQGERLERQVKEELEIMELVNHPHIVRLMEHFEDDDRIYIVMDYHEGGSLYKKLQKKYNGGLSESLVAKYILELSYAVDYLHSLNIVHRDIKPENILLSQDNIIKLCDFGWSTQLGHTQTLADICGTLDYIPPEMVKGNPYDYRVDLWNIGVLTYELLVGEAPFVTPTHRGTYLKILDLEYTFPDYLSDGAKDFIMSLLVTNPSERMEANQIPTHPWIQSHYNM